MRTYDEILDLAARHHGGQDKVLAAAENTYAARDLARLGDDRYLSLMTRCVFNAGFNWKVIENKWDGFEAAFEGFDPVKLSFFGSEMLDSLVSDTRIVRNGQKIKATLENARFVAETSTAHKGFGRFLQDWPETDQLGLLDVLLKQGARLGGATGQYFLRFSGWDAWITSRDVCTALAREGVLDKPEAKSKTALKAVQDTFNALHEDSGRPRAEISRVLAMSVG